MFRVRRIVVRWRGFWNSGLVRWGTASPTITGRVAAFTASTPRREGRNDPPCALLERLEAQPVRLRAFFAEAALEVGLVNRIVPPTEANGAAQATARKLAAKPLNALVETKRLMKKGQAAQVAAQMAEEGASFGRMLREPAAREAFGAFMEKRKPDFSRF